MNNKIGIFTGFAVKLIRFLSKDKPQNTKRKCEKVSQNE
jgi:hypothetical protein